MAINSKVTEKHDGKYKISDLLDMKYIHGKTYVEIKGMHDIIVNYPGEWYHSLFTKMIVFQKNTGMYLDKDDLLNKAKAKYKENMGKEMSDDYPLYEYFFKEFIFNEKTTIPGISMLPTYIIYFVVFKNKL